MKNYKSGEGKYAVSMSVFETGGHGLCAFISGGQLPHVGGSALAVFSGSAAAALPSCAVSSLCAPGHKDVLIAAAAAERLCHGTRQTVSVTVGIHVDNASSQEIRILSENALKVVEEYLQQGSKQEE